MGISGNITKNVVTVQSTAYVQYYYLMDGDIFYPYYVLLTNDDSVSGLFIDFSI